MTGIDPPHVSSVSFEPVLASWHQSIHAHTCPTPNIRIHEHFKTSPEESLSPDTLPPLNGTNSWLDSYNTRICTNCYTPSPLTDKVGGKESPKSTLYFAAASRKGICRLNGSHKHNKNNGDS